MQKLRSTVTWMVFIAATVLLGLHVADVPGVNIDGVTLTLMGFILVMPLVDFVRKIRVGEFEAEIDPREVSRAVENATGELGKGQRRDLVTAEVRSETGLLDTVRFNPALGLAQLRMDIERSLRLLDRLTGGTHSEKPVGLSRLASALRAREVIPTELDAAIRDLLPIANRAIHGESVRPEDAFRIAEVGVEILQELRWILSARELGTVDHRIITPAERDELAEARYRVCTVVPLVSDPYMVTRELDQAGLADLLAGYGDSAEFLVGIERIV